MQPDLVENVATGLSVALLLTSFALLLNGQALSLGFSCRSGLEPLLQSIRSRSALSRSELADATILAAMAVAAGGAIATRSGGALVLLAMLGLGRPLVRRATSQDHKLLAVAGSFSIDLAIGFYVPIVVAQIILLNVVTAAILSLVIVALSWPAGGGSAVPGRRWQLAPVPTA